MCADEPCFEHDPEPRRHLAGVVAHQFGHGLIDVAAGLLDRLRHVTMSHRVHGPVRGWEGRIWEVGDGEVDGPVPTRSVYAEGELFYDPALEGVLPKLVAYSIELFPGADDVVVGPDLDVVGDVPGEEGQAR